MRLAKNILVPGVYTKPNIYLCQPDKEKICKLETSETKASLKFNSLSELSFEVARFYMDEITGETLVNPYYDQIEAFRLVLVEGFGYFELQGPELIGDGIKECKSCKANSFEYVLSTKYLDNFYVNQGTVDSLEVLNAKDANAIVPITLYNKSNPELSLLHLALEKCYGCWTVGHVDTQLQTMSRQFDVDRESIYDFLMNDVCEKFNCYIVFDTFENTINVYAESPVAKFRGDGETKVFKLYTPFENIETVSIDGYKTTEWEYVYDAGAGAYCINLTSDEAPIDGAYIEVVGVDARWDTDVFISFDNLAQEVNVNYDADSIKTVLTVTYGDDLDIREVNLGLPYLTDISYYHTVDWMGQDLYDAYTAYIRKCNASTSAYAHNAREVQKFNNQIHYHENRLSLEYSIATVDGYTVGTYYVRQTDDAGGVYYSQVSLPTDWVSGTKYYSNLTSNVDETKVKNLHTALQKYVCGAFTYDSDAKEKAKKELQELEGFTFLEEYTLADFVDDLESAGTNKEAINTVIASMLNQFWPELGRTPLNDLYLMPYKKSAEVAREDGWSSTSHKNHGSYFVTMCFIETINAAIEERVKTIDEIKDKQSKYSNANIEISNELLMTKNFTQDQLQHLSAFLREDELHLDDFVETSLTDLSGSFALKQDAMESGRIELKKLCQPQLQFSMTMANIYALSEFEPIMSQFQLGNVIRVELRPGYVKQSRLLQVDINLDDFSDFSCEFGELTNLRTQSSIHADLLSNAISAGKSVANYSSYWSKGSDTASKLQTQIQQGLLDAATEIKAIDGNQGVTIGNYGIKLQKVNESGNIDPKQGWIVNNKFLYSDDGFNTSKAVFGEFELDGQNLYGILAEALVGEMILGSKLKIENFSGGLTFDDDGLRITNDINTFTVNPKNQEALLKISNKEDGDVFWVDADGKLHICGDGAGLDLQANSSVSNLSSQIAQTSNEISLKVGRDDIISAINMSPEELKINADRLTIDASNIVLEGLVTANGNFKVLMDGSIEAANANISGTIYANAGDIGGCTIDSEKGLMVTQAHIEGELTANSIEVKDGDNVLLSAGGNTVAIAGWNVTENSLESGDGNNYVGLFSSDQAEGIQIGSSPSKKTWRILAGQDFGVDVFGNVYANNINITGGQIGVPGANNKPTLGFNDDGTLDDTSWKAYIKNLGFGEGGEGGSVDEDYIVDVVTRELHADADSLYGAVVTVIDNKLETDYIVAKELEVSHNGNIVFFASSGSTDLDKEPQVVIGGWLVDEHSLYTGTIDQDGELNLDVGLFNANSTKNATINDVNRNDWRIVAGNNKFGVAADGTLSAEDAYISGHINAKTGSIGGWDISSESLCATIKDGEEYITEIGLYPKDTVTTSIAGSEDKSNWRIIAGSQFGVDSDGNVYAENAFISGTVTATKGSHIGDCTVGDDGKLQVGFDNLGQDTDWQTYLDQLGYGKDTEAQEANIVKVISDALNEHNEQLYGAFETVIEGKFETDYAVAKALKIENDNGVIIQAGEIILRDGDGNPLTDADGNAITENTAIIGGWIFDQHKIYSGTVDESGKLGAITAMFSADADSYDENGDPVKLSIGDHSAHNWRFVACDGTADSEGRRNGFGVTADGVMSATNAIVSGRIYANDGDIGGCTFSTDGKLIVKTANITGSLHAGGNITLGDWKIDENSLYYGDKFSTAQCFLCTGSKAEFEIGNSGSISGWSLKAGDNFGVTSDGKLYANNADIIGHVYADNGNIGGWTIDEHGIYNKHIDTPELGDYSPYVETILSAYNQEDNAALTIGGITSSHWALYTHVWEATKGDIYPFGITHGGQVAMTSGNIGGWVINETNLERSQIIGGVKTQTVQLDEQGVKFSVYGGNASSISPYNYSDGAGVRISTTSQEDSYGYIMFDCECISENGNIDNQRAYEIYCSSDGYVHHSIVGDYVITSNFNDGAGTNSFHIDDDGLSFMQSTDDDTITNINVNNGIIAVKGDNVRAEIGIDNEGKSYAQFGMLNGKEIHWQDNGNGTYTLVAY